MKLLRTECVLNVRAVSPQAATILPLVTTMNAWDPSESINGLRAATRAADHPKASADSAAVHVSVGKSADRAGVTMTDPDGRGVQATDPDMVPHTVSAMPILKRDTLFRGKE